MARSNESSRHVFFVTGLVLWLVASVVMTTNEAQAGAQEALGAINGRLVDESEGVLPGGTVTLTEESSGTSRTVFTDGEGEFTVSELPFGSYTLRATMPGFAEYELKQVVVGEASPDVVLTVTLGLAAMSESVTVDASADPFQIVPRRETNSLFGLAKSIEKIPRSISVVEADHIERYDVRSVNDLVTVAPGSFTGSYFGVPGSVFIRGAPSDNFFRGFRRVENRGNYATPVAASDHIQIVKGPPSPVHGGGKIGGFLNFVPKSARSTSARWMDRPQGKSSITMGSYDQRVATAEVGVPFTVAGNRAGLYAFWQGEDSDSFYDGIYSRSNLAQIAFDVELSPQWRLEFGAQGYVAERPQNIGWNRVTQDLVDNKQYLAGTPLVPLSSNGVDLATADLRDGALEQFAFSSDMGSIFASDPAFAEQAGLFQLDPSTTHLVTLEHNQIFVDSPDFSDASTVTAYFDVINEIRPGLTLKNQTFYDLLDHTKYSTYGFAADYRPWVIENKTSLDFTFAPTPGIELQNTTGVSYRYSRVEAGESRGRGYQVIDRRDLSVGALPEDRFQGPFNSNPQVPFNYYQGGSYNDTGLFWLSEVSLGAKLNVIGGLRVDVYNPNFTGRFNGEPLSTSTSSDTAFTYNTSVIYELVPGWTPYFTYATSTYLEVGQGSELDQGLIANGTYLQDSNLYEGGLKFTGTENRLFASVAVFRQERSAANSETSASDFFRTTGVEVEARAAVNPSLSFTGAYTWQRPEQLNIPFLLGIPPSLLGLTPEAGYGGRFIGFADIFDIELPVRVAGQPAHVGSLFGTYLFRRDAGFTLGTTIVSGVNAGYVSPVHLPGYTDWRGSLFYKPGHWGVNLNINNLFNEEYYQSQYLFWDVFIKPSQLRTLSLTFEYGF